MYFYHREDNNSENILWIYWAKVIIKETYGNIIYRKKESYYKEIKKEQAKNRRKAGFIFLQLGWPSGYSGFFFLALTRKMFIAPFSQLHLIIYNQCNTNIWEK